MEKANHQLTKEHNTSLVLKTIFKEESISRADIARTTDLNRTTVSAIVSELIGRGLVKETGIGIAPIGKPPILVNFDADARQLLCVDLSEHELRGALLDMKGRVVRRHAVELGEAKGEAALHRTFQLIETLWGQAKAPILGIGIGTPGRVDPASGLILQAVNRGWVHLALRRELETRYEVPIHLANDCHAAALAECAFGGHREASSLILVKAGDGVGSGIVVKGQLFAGEHYGAGEIGHLCVERDGPRCTCGNRGCLETFATTPAVLQAIHDQARRGPETRFGLAVAQRGASLELLAESLAGREPEAFDLVRELGARLGTAIASLAAALDAGRIVLSGPLALLGEPLLKAIRAELRTRILPDQADETQVSCSTLGPDAVIQGACALVLRRELNLP